MPKLYMILLGCKPPGRFIEQHDIFFTIGEDLPSLLPEIIAFWPEANGKIHIDAWREVNTVNGHSISIVPKRQPAEEKQPGLFFLNLGGYKKEEFDELHYMMLVVADTKAAAIKQGKETAFYKHMGFSGATSHIDDKYGVDVDDIYDIDDILSPALRAQYSISIVPAKEAAPDAVHLGYLPLRNIK